MCKFIVVSDMVSSQLCLSEVIYIFISFMITYLLACFNYLMASVNDIYWCLVGLLLASCWPLLAYCLTLE